MEYYNTIFGKIQQENFLKKVVVFFEGICYNNLMKREWYMRKMKMKVDTGPPM